MARSRRKKSSIGTFLLVAVGLSVAVLLLRGCAAKQALPAPVTPRGPGPLNGLAASPHVALGVPSDADPSDDLLLDEHDFVLSFNTRRLDPNWVAWQLDSHYLGHVRRRDNFHSDESLPLYVHHVTPHDYLHSGYDRGHMCPSADRAANEEMNSYTFVMTNMVPQVHELNAGPWEKLEEHERALVERTDTEVYIVAGPLFDSNPPIIGQGVQVPRATYKIIVSLAAGQVAQAVTPNAEVLSVIIPNTPDVGTHAWTEFVTSVDEVERQSGYDFLTAVPDDVETVIEARTHL